MKPEGGRRVVVALASVGAALVLWYALTATGVIAASRFASPREFWAALVQIDVQGYADAKLWQHALQSCKLVLMGFAVAVAVGVPLGLAMGWSPRVEAFCNPAFLLLRPIPPLAWIPLAIVWLGLGDAAKVMVIFVAAFVPSVINSYTGVRTIEPYLVEAAAMLGIGRASLVREVVVPAALPHIFSGLRLSLQAAWTTLVAGELVGALRGLGQVLNAAAQDIYPAMILVGMVAVGICGGAMTWMLGLAEKRAMPWRGA
ncbi:MAG TPA: ABC transporter permease [Usitatibacter sp.]|nr:ABC transporter permease [Usitatibacter sp.]